MQYLKVDLPDYKYKEYIQRLLALDTSDKQITLFYDLKFMTPFVGVLISSYLNEHGFEVTHEVGTNGEKSVYYAKKNNFFHFAESSKNYEERNTSYTGTYTPIMKSVLIDYFRGAENISEGISNNIARVLSCSNDNAEAVFFYIISEMIRNIPEHSQCFNAWHSSQSWNHEDYIEGEFALVDYGIGFKESFNFKEVYNPSNDIEAMKLALKPGITSGITEKSHLRENEEADYLNSGYGLYIVTELCKKIGGQYIIISKSAIATNKGVKNLKNGKIFPGTAIKIRLRIPKNLTKEGFRRVLDEVVKSGELKSQTINGAIKIASCKSRGKELSY